MIILRRIDTDNELVVIQYNNGKKEMKTKEVAYKYLANPDIIDDINYISWMNYQNKCVKMKRFHIKDEEDAKYIEQLCVKYFNKFDLSSKYFVLQFLLPLDDTYVLDTYAITSVSFNPKIEDNDKWEKHY